MSRNDFELDYDDLEWAEDLGTVRDVYEGATRHDYGPWRAPTKKELKSALKAAIERERELTLTSKQQSDDLYKAERRVATFDEREKSIREVAAIATEKAQEYLEKNIALSQELKTTTQDAENWQRYYKQLLDAYEDQRDGKPTTFFKGPVQGVPVRHVPVRPLSFDVAQKVQDNERSELDYAPFEPPPKRNELKWVAIDFDGTVAFSEYSAVSNKYELGHVMPGARRKMLELEREGYKIHIHTARPSAEYETVEKYLIDKQLPFTRITCGKLLAELYVDDRARHADAESWLP